MRRLTATLLCALATLALAACGEGDDGSSLTGTIPVGAVWSLTGFAQPFGVPSRDGANLAVEEINRSGLLGEAELALFVEDDGSAAAGGQAAFQRLLDQRHVAAILGPTLSAVAFAADPLAQDAGVPVLGVTNTADGITALGNFIFRGALAESQVVPNTVSVTRQRLGYTQVALMFDDSDAFTISSAAAFRTALQQQGVTIVAEETFQTGDTDFATQLGRVLAADPQAVMVAAFADEAVGIMVQGRAAGLPTTVPFIGGNGFNTLDIAERAGAAAEGAISGASWHAGEATPGNAAFVANYRARYGVEANQYAAQSYAGVYLLAQAIRNADSADPAAIRAALAQLQGVPTVLGDISFDAQRNALYTPVVQQVQDGEFVLF